MEKEIDGGLLAKSQRGARTMKPDDYCAECGEFGCICTDVDKAMRLEEEAKKQCAEAAIKKQGEER